MAMSVRASHSPFISVPFYFRVKCNCSGLVNVVAEAKCHSSVLKFLSVLSLSRFETLTSSLQGGGGAAFLHAELDGGGKNIITNKNMVTSIASFVFR